LKIRKFAQGFTLKPKVYDRRPHATDTALPVPGV